MQRHGWTLLFHEGVILQLRKLQEAAARAEHNDPQSFEGNGDVKLFRALSHLIIDSVPSDPARDELRQGNTLGQLIAIGGGQRSAGDFGYSFATTRSPGLSSMRGLTTKTPYGPQAASQTLTPCSKRGWAVATLLMTGMH